MVPKKQDETRVFGCDFPYVREVHGKGTAFLDRFHFTQRGPESHRRARTARTLQPPMKVKNFNKIEHFAQLSLAGVILNFR